MEKRETPIMFRVPKYIDEILESEGKEKLLSKNLVAKFYLFDHMIDLKLIPKKLIPYLIKDIAFDFFEEIKLAYNLSNEEMKSIIKKVEELKDARHNNK